MPFTYGEGPENGFLQIPDGLPDLTHSAFAQIEIVSAQYSYGVASPDPANPVDPALIDPIKQREAVSWERIAIKAVTLNAESKPEAWVNFSFFLSQKQHITSLLYFLNMRNAQGCLELPDPKLHEGISSKTGREYRFFTFPCLEAAKVWALLKYDGMSISQRTGKSYPQFELIGFADGRGIDAPSLDMGLTAPCPEYQAFFDTLNRAPAAPQAQPVPQPQPLTRPQAAQYGAAANRQARAAKPAAQPAYGARTQAQPVPQPVRATGTYGAQPQAQAPAQDEDIPF